MSIPSFGTPRRTDGTPEVDPLRGCLNCAALRRQLATVERERDEALRLNAEQGERLRTAQARIAALEAALHSHPDREKLITDLRALLAERESDWHDMGSELRKAKARVKKLEGRLYAYADEAHRLSDCLRAYDGGGIPSSDAHKAFGLLHTIEQDVGLKPMDERKAREAAEAAEETPDDA